MFLLMEIQKHCNFFAIVIKIYWKEKKKRGKQVKDHTFISFFVH